MADWYCGSVQYTAVTQWAATHAYSIGDIVRQLAAPAFGSERCFRCTTAGTSGGSEPAWNLGKGATTASGTATFTEVTGNSTYNWLAPHATITTAANNTYSAAGDRVFVAQNHAESRASGNTAISNSNSGITGPVYVICVNAAGSVPPVAADLRTTATVTCAAGEIQLWNAVAGCGYFYGINFVSNSNFRIGIPGGNFTVLNFDSCNFTMGGNTNGFFLVGSTSAGSPGRVSLNNCQIIFGHSTQGIYASGEFYWSNTASAIGAGTVPAVLFSGSSSVSSTGGSIVVCDGLDLSAVNTQLFSWSINNGGYRAILKNCKLNGSVLTTNATQNFNQVVEIVGCDNAGTCSRNERASVDGKMTTETTIVRTQGASDGTTSVSWKVVTGGNPTKQHQFECPTIHQWNDAISASKTATVEIVNDGTTLNNDDIWLELEFLTDAGDPLATIVSSRAATLLTTGSAIPTSTATWTTTGLTTPIKQKLQVTFTPQMKGLVRGKVCMAKINKTVYVDPMITIT